MPAMAPHSDGKFNPQCRPARLTMFDWSAYRVCVTGGAGFLAASFAECFSSAASAPSG